MARGRWIVIPLLVALLVGAAVLAGRLGEVTSSEQTLPGSEAARGADLIDAHFSGGTRPRASSRSSATAL
jgi:hypothetical protein